MKRLTEILDAKELAAIIGADWEGWSWGEGKICAPEWTQGLGPEDIRALPYLNTLAEAYRRANRNYEMEMARMRDKLEIATRNEEHYRSQLKIAARLGRVLQRIVD